MSTAPARQPSDEPGVKTSDTSDASVGQTNTKTGGSEQATRVGAVPDSLDGHVIEIGRREAGELARRMAAIVESSSDAMVRETLTAVFQAANDAILLFDPAADCILDANPRARRLLEYDDLDGLLKTPASTVLNHESDQFRPFVADCLENGFGRMARLSCPSRKGRIIPAEVSASTLELAQGVALLTVIRDLTEQQEAEADQGRLAAIVKGSVDAIVGLDLQGVITTWNPAAERLLGYTADDVIGRHVNDLVPAEGRPQQRAAHLRALRGELVRDWECERIRRDSTLIPVSITLSVIRDANGVPLGLAKFVRDVADRKRYERERDIAATLQHALLPEAAPQLPGLTVATRYFPGGAGLRVGGDWYDVFALPGGRLGVAVGDVVGHGVAAAAVMGQLRVGLRAYALEFSSPATVLACLSRLAGSLDDSQMATVLYGVVDPDSATIELACAGHPPPLVVSAKGETRFLHLDSAPPLGVLVDLPPTQVVEHLEAGSVVLFYTDGLIERRGASIEDGMAAAASAAARGPADVESLCERVSEAMDAQDAPDDVALLALSLVGAPVSEEPAKATSVWAGNQQRRAPSRSLHIEPSKRHAAGVGES